MFGRIVPRYDLLNRRSRRGMAPPGRRAAPAAAQPADSLALDVGAGTGGLALELRRQGAAHVVGADFSSEMLATAGAKAAAAGDAGLSWALADALALPFPDNTFDCVTNAFLLRNLADLRAGLAEMARVLKPDGRLVCLDATQPPPGLFGSLYRLYFNHLLPPLAGTISGDRAAYRYLPNSLEGFPKATDLAAILADIGLSDVRFRLLAGGTVALHTGRRPLIER
ncbi:MAG: ubiquinone/menaquinone biosynthesis methyltransferase [Dehalococcoidia bacterium]|nr:MAG: ubiquinone/menaquinone biosynthesis methyltransferase [Dehalococcoidia bacterium]